MRFLARRLVHTLFLLAGVSLLCFVFTSLAPGSYFDEMELNPQISPGTVAALKTQYGLDKPLPMRYAIWLKAVLKGNWGYSLAYNSPVRALLMVRARNTLLLTGIATLLAWMIALPLGTWAASRPESWSDRLCMGAMSLLLAVPELVLVLLLLYLVVRTNTFPAGGMISVGSEQLGFWARVRDIGMHLTVPLAALVLASLPILVQHVRTSMREVLGAPFVQAARGHGVSNFRLLFRYALPAGANPLISLFGFSIGGLLSASLLVEAVVGWPGLGPFLLEAATSRDLYVVIAVVMASAFFMVMGNLLADVLLLIIDPRIRAD
jgi:peptide/nickel transport system permease protein